MMHHRRSVLSFSIKSNQIYVVPTLTAAVYQYLTKVLNAFPSLEGKKFDLVHVRHILSFFFFRTGRPPTRRKVVKLPPGRIKVHKHRFDVYLNVYNHLTGNSCMCRSCTLSVFAGVIYLITPIWCRAVRVVNSSPYTTPDICEGSLWKGLAFIYLC